MTVSKIDWFSQEFATLEACKKSYSPAFFEGIAIFKNTEGKYVRGNLRQVRFERQEAIDMGDAIEELTGNQIVAFHNGIGWWNDVYPITKVAQS